MHKEVRDFVTRLKDRFPGQFKKADVLEYGARDINGSVRYLFDDSTILGVDCVDGPNVDVVSYAHDFKQYGDEFSCVFSTEALEHDPWWQKTLDAMVKNTMPGGLMFFTCATTGRPEHGTTDKPYHTGHCEGPDPSYYRNLTEDDIRETLVLSDFSEYGFEVMDCRLAGLFFWGIVK